MKEEQGKEEDTAAPAVINTCKRRSMSSISRGERGGGGMQDLRGVEGYGGTCDCDCARGLTLSIERHKRLSRVATLDSTELAGLAGLPQAAQLVFVATVASGVD